MNILTLNQDNSATVAQWLRDGHWVTACLCAAWCDTCTSYRAKFDELASMHPERRFVWIDIEDQADLIGDFDIENFPTLLIQQNGVVSFFGTTLPDMKLADRLLRAQIEKGEAELRREAASSEERRHWQSERNLASRLSQT
ncbi:MAG: thioredoxin family protein [Burkholderiaceae bacterium]|nr:thioredoxin family protein [Burkholderiaceae bacterium]